jgi:predicted GNAT family acetyltransferase
MTHHVIIERDAQSFWKRYAEFLLRRESEHNLIIGHVLSILSSGSSRNDLLFFVIRQTSEVVGIAIYAGGDRPLLISDMSLEAAHALTEAIAVRSLMPRQVRGPAEPAECCARALAQRRGGLAQLTQRQGVYELRSVIWPDPGGGALVCGTREQQDLSVRWMEGFVRESFPEESEPTVRAKDIVERRLSAGHIYFWKNAEGDLVSMAARVRETPNTTSISLVYTPPERRGQGHARSVVAHLSQLWLDRGKTACNLFTNLANPASNRAYVRIGYVQLLESHIYTIEKA